MNIENHTPIEVFYLPRGETPARLVEEESPIDARPLEPLSRIVWRRTTRYGFCTPQPMDPVGKDICRHCLWFGRYDGGRSPELRKLTVVSIDGWPWCSQYVPSSDRKEDLPPEKFSYTLSVELWKSETLGERHFCDACLYREPRHHTFEARADVAIDWKTRGPFFHVVPSVVARCVRCQHATVIQRKEELDRFDLVLAKKLCSVVFSRDAKRVEWR